MARLPSPCPDTLWWGDLWAESQGSVEGGFHIQRIHQHVLRASLVRISGQLSKSAPNPKPKNPITWLSGDLGHHHPSTIPVVAFPFLKHGSVRPNPKPTTNPQTSSHLCSSCAPLRSETLQLLSITTPNQQHLKSNNPCLAYSCGARLRQFPRPASHVKARSLKPILHESLQVHEHRAIAILSATEPR